MGEIADKLVQMGESKRVTFLGNLRSLVSGNNIEQFHRYFGLLTDYDFIEAKINHPSYGVQLLIEDYELVDSSLFRKSPEYAETLENLNIIKQALRLSAHVINPNTKQLAGQLTGRLLPFNPHSAP